MLKTTGTGFAASNSSSFDTPIGSIYQGSLICLPANKGLPEKKKKVSIVKLLIDSFFENFSFWKSLFSSLILVGTRPRTNSAVGAVVLIVWRGAGFGAQVHWIIRTSEDWGQSLAVATCFLLQVPVSKLDGPVCLPSCASSRGMPSAIAALIAKSLAARGPGFD